MGLVTSISRRRLIGRLAAMGASAAGLVLLGGCALVPSTSQPAKVPRVGFIGPSPDAPWVKPMWDGLRELGWVEGQNLSVERRDQTGATPQNDQIAAAVAELVAIPVDVLVTGGTPAALAAREATRSIPIVFVNVSDPVGVRVVASLAQPGGNVTGVSSGASTPLFGKQLELLRAVVPGLTHLAILYDTINPASNALAQAERQEAAEPLGVQVQALYVAFLDDLPSAFATAASWPAHGVMVAQSALLLSERGRIAELAGGMQLPAMYHSYEFVESGGLMSYGTSQRDIYMRAAVYVDKILRGARPADLPVEQLTRVEFAVNVKAAQALGLTFPPDIATQVTEWVP
jgi:putative ABC transport system substrate-binding protein